MKRLLCIVGKMDAGGAETFLMKIYRNIDRSMFQMDFAVSVQEKGFYDDEIKSLGGKIYHINPKSDGFVKNFCAIKSVVKDNDYKYVMRISQHSLSALELLAARMGGAEVRVFRSSNSNTTSSSKVNQYLHRLCRFMPLMFANVRIAPSTEAAEFMFGKNCIQKGTAILIHNAIDLEVYKFDENARREIQRNFGIEGKFVVGHVGRFNKQKNHMYLLDIFNELQKSVPDSILLLIGKGELMEQVKTRVEELGIQDKVIFAGVRSDVPQLLSAMDVFLFPSLYEGMPNTVVEAQATGLPCVISDTITREANITGLVTYLPLSASTAAWVEKVLGSRYWERPDVKMNFINDGYEIGRMVNQFTEIVFRENKHLESEKSL